MISKFFLGLKPFHSDNVWCPTTIATATIKFQFCRLKLMKNLNIYPFRDDTHTTSMKIIQFSRPPTPLVQLRPKFFHPLDHNPRKENIIQRDDYFMLSGLSLRSAFVFSINSLILPGFPLTSFHLAEANLVPRAF